MSTYQTKTDPGRTTPKSSLGKRTGRIPLGDLGTGAAANPTKNRCDLRWRIPQEHIINNLFAAANTPNTVSMQRRNKGDRLRL